MGPTDRFSPDEVQRIVGLTEKQLDYWERLRLISPRKEKGIRYYDFRDLIGLRTVKQLVENGVPANRLRRALAALREKLAHAEAPLAELRVLSDGGTVIVERGGARLDPLSGQFMLNFQMRELNETVRVMTRRRAHARLALAHFNLGSVLDETGHVDAARQHLRQAVRLNPIYPDAHYNLAFVCEKLKAYAEAKQHWQAYVRLDPTGPWASYARQRCTSSKATKSAGTT